MQAKYEDCYSPVKENVINAFRRYSFFVCMNIWKEKKYFFVPYTNFTIRETFKYNGLLVYILLDELYHLRSC